ncbi:MAG TPA: response regulator transcription factor [Candidatus Sulfotelmatobacter sp.]|nr:response regulator transcription factor [Candidatus Sulfotelmatobacter sp.]
MCPHAPDKEVRSIRCALVHDVVLLRQGLRRLLEDEPDISVVAEAGNAAEALRGIFEQRPEVVILATHIFGYPTERAEKLVLQECPATKVVFLTTREAEEPQTAQNGSTYAARHTSAEELIGMVRSAVGVQTGSLMGSEERGPVEFVPRHRMLTAREQEVLKLLAEGRTVRSVAGILGLSIKTVDAHKFNLMRKLGIHNKAELVMWAIQKKVVKVPVNF